ncbi:MAG: molybdopterin cofactor-binding domain-containing protein [Rhodomicrobiaceae bacterium]
MLHQLEKFSQTSEALPASAFHTLIRKVKKAELRRRSVLQGLGGFVLAMYLLPGKAEAFPAYPTHGSGMPNGLRDDPHIFVSIAPNGEVTIVAHRSEMGTGIRTTLPMVIADEMEADWDRVKVVQADGDEAKYGNQDTDGSRSLRHHIQPAREMGAAVRKMLELAAAKQWGADPSLVEARAHHVTHKTLGIRLSYGELAKAAMALDTPPRDQLRFKEDGEFRYIGKGNVQIVDLHDITTGKAVYGADVSLPGMKYAVIARPPVVGSKIKSVDDKAARAVPGVEHIVQLPVTPLGSKFKPLGGVAVVAKNTWAAIQGRDALKIEWEKSEHSSFNTKAYEKELRASVAKPGSSVRNQGDAEAALKSAAKVMTYEYYQPHVAHAPMEPPAAIANVTGDKCEIWAPVQSPDVARKDTAEYIGLDPKNVTLHVTLLGGAFGRKSKADYATEAAFLSKDVGAPVRVQWTREDDIRHSYYHTTSVERIDVGLDKDSKVVAWRHRSAAPSFLSTFAPDKGVQHEIEIGMGLENLPYDIANISAEQCKAFAHTRVGWYRSVSNIPRAFAVQSATAELAAALGKDQKDYLLELIGPPRVLDAKACGLPGKFWNQYEPYEEFPFDTGRLANVARIAAEQAGWGKTLPKGEGLGIAVHRSFVSYIAMVVRAKVEKGKVRVPEVHVAVDCGFAANPERIQSQMQGACVFGMATALYLGVTFVDGAVQESNYNDYEMTRSDNFPEVVHTHIVPHPFSVHATGIGEPGVPPFIPALTNAIFNASGKRIRDLPIGDQLA